jgi:uncharacterized damage-inducible protein DinB
MPIVDALLAEMEQEAATTRRVLERVPDDKLAWKPHAKSMSLGQLTRHVAEGPAQIAGMIVPDTFEMPDFGEQPSPASAADAVKAHDEGLATVKRIVGGMDDAALGTVWRVTKGGQELLAMPKGAVVRSLLMNHIYHHRGQLSVYLRLLDVPVPSIYGPSADENPFG